MSKTIQTSQRHTEFMGTLLEHKGAKAQSTEYSGTNQQNGFVFFDSRQEMRGF
jgi:hypothetical protein